MQKKNMLILSLMAFILIVGVTISATFSFNKYGETIEIHFYTNGGEKLDNVYYTYGKDKLLEKLPVPKKEGYIFKGWFLDNTLETRVRTTPNPNFNDKTIVHLYAKWGLPEKEEDIFNPLTLVILALLILIVIVGRNVIIKIDESKELEGN